MSWLKSLMGVGIVEDTVNDWNFSDVSSWGGVPPAAGIRVDQNVAMTCATAYACTRAISETLASLPGIVYEATDENTRQRANGHDMWRLLHDRPNPDMDSMTFFELTTARAVNRGNGYAEIERNNRDEPVALWPLHNSRVTPWRTPDGELEFHVHTSRNDLNTKVDSYYVVPKRNMLNLVGHNSTNGITAPGVVPNASEEISLDIASQQYGATWFGNGARPAGLVKHPAFIRDKDRRDEFRRDLNTIHQGRENWNKVGILWEGAEWQNIEVSPDQAQFLGTRQWQSKVLCRFWNVPPAIVQIFEDYKFATVDAMIKQFVMLTLRPWAVRWERAIKRQIFSVTDNGRQVDIFRENLVFEFLLNALLRGDPETQAKADGTYISHGVISPNEVRRRDNLNPYVGGDDYWMPLNFAQVDTLRHEGKQGGNVETGMPKFDKQQVAAMLEQSVEADRSKFAGYAVQVWSETWRRMVAIERNAATRAAAKPEKWLTWLDDFYDKHRATMLDALNLPHLGMVESGALSADIVGLISAHIERHKQQLLDAADGDPKTFADRVGTIVSNWGNKELEDG